MKSINNNWTIRLDSSGMTTTTVSYNDRIVDVSNIDDIKNAFAYVSLTKKLSVPVDVVNIIGFVYIIRFSDNTFYIGKKNLFTTKTVAKGKKELASMSDRRGSKKKVVSKESDWKSYFGTIKDEEFNNNIKNGTIKIISKEIIEIASSKSQLTYLETKYQFVCEVLENENSRNSNILGKFYRKSLE